MEHVLTPNRPVLKSADTEAGHDFMVQTPGDAQEQDPRIQQEHLAMRNRIRTQCFDVLYDAVKSEESVMTMRDIKDYMKGLEEKALTRPDLMTHDKKIAALENLLEHARSFARETMQLGSQILKEVRQAKGDDISDESLERWKRRLKKRPHGEDFRKVRDDIHEFLHSTLPQLRAQWRQLSSDIREVKAHASTFNITAKEVPLLGEIESDAFKRAKFPLRRKKVDRALKILRASKAGKGTFYADVRTFLEEQAESGVMARAKIGQWIQRIFVGKSPADAKKFFQQTVKPYCERWKQVRERFDLLHAEMRDIGMPRGFTPCAPEDFLQKSYDQRLAYVNMLDMRLHPEGKPVTKLCGDIWNAFDNEDWHDAGRLIDILEASFPSHSDLGPMVQYLETHRTDVLKGAPPQQDTNEFTDEDIVDEANQMLRHYPAIRIVLGRSMEEDSKHPKDDNKRTRLLGRMMYNLVWAERRGYTNENEQLRDSRDERNKMLTWLYINEGHGNDVEKPQVGGSTARKPAIRKHCTSAQLIYMESTPEAQHVVFNALDECKDNENFGYWSDLKPIGMSLSRHHTFVEHDSKHIKWLMWQMHDRGITFTPEQQEVDYVGHKKESPPT